MYYCTEWVQRIEPSRDGNTMQELWDENHCNRFAANQRVYFDADDEERDIGETSDIVCMDHDTDPDWLGETATLNRAARDLERRFVTCPHCGIGDNSEALVFPDIDSMNQHNVDEHQQNEDADEGYEAPAPPAPAQRVEQERVVINVARGRTWFTNVTLPDWVPPMIDAAIRAGRINNTQAVGRAPASQQPVGVLYRDHIHNGHEVIVRGETREYFRDPTHWNPEWTRVEIWPTPPVRTSHSLFPSNQP